MSSSTTDIRRVRSRNDQPIKEGAVVYWMQRDQRTADNWALLYAQQCAIKQNAPLYVVFNLVATYGEATLRQYDFMLQGLHEVAGTLSAKNISFHLTTGEPADTLPRFCAKYVVGHVVTDFNPLRLPEAWTRAVAEVSSIRVSEVDAHNIIPCWNASEKEEFAAHTFRPKVHRQLGEWLVDIPELEEHPYPPAALEPIDWEASASRLDIDRSIGPVAWLTPGESAAREHLEDFMSHRLSHYCEDRNDPNERVLSDLSPYLHFGQISAQRVALEIECKRGIERTDKDAFLEELIVRRELTDNFCYYNKQYDRVDGAHAWARETIAAHADDAREYTYSQEQFEQAKTHDALWNAMQIQMVETGKMHGWCRMYWAKKILEWSLDNQTAVDIALYLNDKYELDGRDPNGVVGVMWSICGVHDRAWTERPIFGKIRYMNYNGAKRKFDVDAYVARYTGAETEELFDDEA